jgi:hypothetical protein
MSSGVYGSVRPAVIDNIGRDVEIFYNFRESRGQSSNFKNFIKLDAANILIPTTTTSEKGDIFSINGLYNLRLPVDIFFQKGFYTIYIRPKELVTPITDVSVLAAYPEIKGVVFNINNGILNGITDLTGYKIEFEDGTTRLIKSCNYCEPVIVNVGDGSPKSTRYNLTDSSSSLVFCTVSPSVAQSFKPNASPYIGEAGVEVYVSNTKFSPQLIEVEMVDHDIDTLSYMLEGDQVNDRDNAIITTYNDNHEIYHQSDYYVLKDSLGNPLYNVRKKRTTIDSNQDYNNIINNG